MLSIEINEPLCYVALFLHMYVSLKSTCGHRWVQATAMGVSSSSKLLRTCQPLVSLEISPNWSIFNIKVFFFFFNVIFLLNFLNFASVLLLMPFTYISVLSFTFFFFSFYNYCFRTFSKFCFTRNQITSLPSMSV